MTDLDGVERELRDMVAGHRRDGLGDATIHNMPAIARPDVPKHDYFAASTGARRPRGSTFVSWRTRPRRLIPGRR